MNQQPTNPPPGLSDNTLAELQALEDYFYGFFQQAAKNPDALRALPESDVHSQFQSWLVSSPALVGTFRMHGSRPLLSLLATIYQTMGDEKECEHIQQFSS